MIVGGLVTHNTRPEDLERAVASLRAVSDQVVAFDDASDNGTYDRLRGMVDVIMGSGSPEPRLLQLRRAALYSEAERLGADWFVCHDDDEALSPTIQANFRGLLSVVPDESRSLSATHVHFYGDLLHRKVCAQEFFAWRANQGFSYYAQMQRVLFQAPDPSDESWHCTRPPIAAQRPGNALKFPKYALLHYGMSSQDRLEARREWYAKNGLRNRLNNEPLPGELADVDPVPEWDKVPAQIGQA